jgi:hypothetical protein
VDTLIDVPEEVCDLNPQKTCRLQVTPFSYLFRLLKDALVFFVHKLITVGPQIGAAASFLNFSPAPLILQ